MPHSFVLVCFVFSPSHSLLTHIFTLFWNGSKAVWKIYLTHIYCTNRNTSHQSEFLRSFFFSSCTFLLFIKMKKKECNRSMRAFAHKIVKFGLNSLLLYLFCLFVPLLYDSCEHILWISKRRRKKNCSYSCSTDLWLKALNFLKDTRFENVVYNLPHRITLCVLCMYVYV